MNSYVPVSSDKWNSVVVGFLVDCSKIVWLGFIWPKNVNNRKGVAMQTIIETIIIMKKEQFLEHFLFLSILSSSLVFLEIETQLSSKAKKMPPKHVMYLSIISKCSELNGFFFLRGQ